ncbi:yecA family protein [Novosphingobium chloroacetimidivorans]|uniref:YecA family protein n=1 Tax=Novosphingobium chloroacetimidivorans TaxID=1428314 RepID=A0A7W7KBH2_9SPHN|nr:UPF0149 family protein [Novosphingobium chloroacetimidivorans]MBB4859194.1 yecA family protein [Novosphingobium chloroacetimidivorans]
MAWQDYEAWRAGEQGDEPEVPLVDGVLSGAVVSLRSFPDEQWIATIVGEPALNAKPGTLQGRAVAHLKHRMAEIRAALTEDQNGYTPLLTVTEEGDFDLTAWATGFIEAIAPDLETWAYVLAHKPEGGLLGLLGSHAVGTMGEAVKTRISQDADRDVLLAASERSWEFIPQLVKALYDKKLELAAPPGWSTTPAS